MEGSPEEGEQGPQSGGQAVITSTYPGRRQTRRGGGEGGREGAKEEGAGAAKPQGNIDEFSGLK
jgi:hypothetical protein